MPAAWVQGFAARLQEADRLDNPFLDAGDGQGDQWDDGWLFAENEIANGAISEPETSR